MKIPAKVNYACRALLELSLNWPGDTPVGINTISNNQNIPLKFLTQIMLSLKQFGFVKSIRGKSGGYLLTKSPKDIFVSEVLLKFEVIQLNQEGNRDAFSDIWNKTNEMIYKELSQYSFEDIKKSSSSNIMYVI